MTNVVDSPGSRVKFRRTLATLVLQSVWLVGSIANAATFVVTASEDEPDAAPGDGACATADDHCTLRAAVDEANALAGHDYIYLATPGSPTYVLEHGALVLSGEVEIAGREARFATIDAQGASRVIELVPCAGEAVYVRLAAVTLSNGFAGPSDPRGGAVLIADPASRLVLERSIIIGSRATGSGGAIYNSGTLEVNRSALQENLSGLDPEVDPAAEGGAIYNAGIASIARTSFDRNEARLGAGLANASGTAQLTNVTFNFNSARERGGALFNAAGASATLAFCTLVNNQAGVAGQPGQGGGVYNAGPLQLSASILANNSDAHSADSPDYAPDCVSETSPGEPPRITSLGGLVLGVSTARCPYTSHASDQSGTAMAPLDPGLDNNGSREFEPSFGFEPLERSVAVNAVVDPALCVNRDQFGARRPGSEFGGATPRCDAGAVERSAELIRRNVMLIVGNRTFAPTDLVLAVKLHDFGFDVFDESPSDLTDEVRERHLAVISETVTSSELPSWLFSITRPILTLEPGALDELGMTRESWDHTQGVVFGESKLNLVPGSPIDIGRTGKLEVADCAKFGWGVPATSDAFTFAELASAPGHWVVFGYAAGARLANGVRAPAARVAFLAATDAPLRMNTTGWSMFEATLNHLLPTP